MVDASPTSTLLTSASTAGLKCKRKTVHFDCEVVDHQARGRDKPSPVLDHDDDAAAKVISLRRPKRRTTPWPTSVQAPSSHEHAVEAQTCHEQRGVEAFGTLKVLQLPDWTGDEQRAQALAEDESGCDVTIPHSADSICKAASIFRVVPPAGAPDGEVDGIASLRTENPLVRAKRVLPEGKFSNALESAAEAVEMTLKAELDSDKSEFMLHFSQFDVLSTPGLEVVEIDRSISYYHSDSTAGKAGHATQVHRPAAQDWVCGPLCGPPREKTSMTKVRSVVLI